jgi:hypothetical protein
MSSWMVSFNFKTSGASSLAQYDDFSELSEPGWIVPEHLIHSVTDKKSIEEEINGAWTIKPSKWIRHSEGGRE